MPLELIKENTVASSYKKNELSTSDKINNTKKKSSKLKKNRQERDWTKANERFTQDPDNHWLSPGIGYATSSVLHFIQIFNPSFPSIEIIREKLKMSKRKVLSCIDELLARKIIKIERIGMGRQSNTYLLNMSVSDWNIDSEKKDLHIRPKSKSSRFPCGTTKKTSGSYAEPQNDLAVPMRNHKNDLAVPVRNPIYINHHTNGEININSKKGPAPLNGPLKNKREESPPTEISPWVKKWQENMTRQLEPMPIKYEPMFMALSNPEKIRKKIFPLRV